LLNRADGSARYTANKTSVLVAVYGPTEVKIKDEIMDRATIKVIFQPKTDIAGPEEREKEAVIRKTLENVIISSLHPRTLITIIIQVLHDDGSLMAASINAACLALMDAGIPLNATVAAVTCALKNDGSFMLDPTEKEERAAEALLTFAFTSVLDGIVTSFTQGTFKEEQYATCVEVAKASVVTLLSYFRKASEQQYQPA